MIDVEKVVKQHGSVVALNGISLHIAAGKRASIMGPSGSGKTTLLHLIAGLDTPTSGRVVVKGQEVSSLRQDERARFRRENIGIVFQLFYLIPYLTALENVMLAQYLHSLPDRDEATMALRLMGLEARADHLPAQLSGGEQQRVAIARAVVNDPAILLADEPTGNLDAESEKFVLAIFQRLQAEGKTIVVVTHNPQVAEAGDEIIRLRHGQVSPL